jgi:hypothetical protein
MVAGGTATGYAVYPNIIAGTGIPLSTLNSAIGVMFLMLGWSTSLWYVYNASTFIHTCTQNSDNYRCPLRLQFGRRGVYVISCFGCMASL